MKLLNVFGLVAGAHLAVFTIIFATPGCRSTGKQAPKPEDTLAAGTDTLSPITPIDPISPVAVPGVNATDLSTPVGVVPVTPDAAGNYTASADGIRFAPTRPEQAPLAPVAPAPAAPRATHTIVAGDSLWSIARKYGISVNELTAANQLAKTATLRLGQQLVVPAKIATATSAAAPHTDAANTYTVASGDTLGAIARKQGTTIPALRAANNLSGDALRVGQKLVIPGNATPSGSSLSAGPSAPAPAPKASGGSYTVVPGDTLGSIARSHGVKVGDLALLNTITDPGKLRVGQVLRLPAGAKSAAAPRAAAPAPAPAVETGPAPVTPVAPSTPVEPMAIPVIRID